MLRGVGVQGLPSTPGASKSDTEIFFLGVDTYAPMPALHTEMEWLEMCKLRCLDIICLDNRIVARYNTRPPRCNLQWDYKCNAKEWLSDMLAVCTQTGITILDKIGFEYDIDPICGNFNCET